MNNMTKKNKITEDNNIIEIQKEEEKKDELQA